MKVKCGADVAPAKKRKMPNLNMGGMVAKKKKVAKKKPAAKKKKVAKKRKPAARKSAKRKR